MSDRVIMFCFGGRRANMELQLPFIHRILDEHPNVEYHLWNLARDPADDAWLRTLHLRHESPRLVVLNDFHGTDPWDGFNLVYQHYAHERYQDALFVKLDDDVVFIETQRFGEFLDAVRTHRNSVISAKVINNGACTRLEPGIEAVYDRLNIPLLDIHESAAYADGCHKVFQWGWQTLISQPVKPIRTYDWLSINLIGYDWEMGQRITRPLGKRSPRFIAGRKYLSPTPLGDEGSVNMVDRIILQGFLACHLYFGPQAKQMTADELDYYRMFYAEIGTKYLELP